MRPSIKRNILHLITDTDVGGVRTALEVLLNSRLSQEFHFSTLFTNQAIQQLRGNSLKPDLIVFHTACSWSAIPKLFCLKWFSKIAIYEHHYNDSFEVKVPSPLRFHLMLWLSYAIADRVIAVSQAQANWMYQHRLVNPKKLKIVTPARALDRMLEVPEISASEISNPEAEALPSSLSLGTYGRFAPEKGFDILIESIKRVPSLLPDLTVKLYIGGYGDQEDHLKALAHSSNNIEFVGIVKDVAQFLQKCDVVVIPSRREAWGIVCMEAKAAARPVIACTVGGLVEQILVGSSPSLEADYGVLVPPENPEVLAQAIAQIGALPKTTLREIGKRSRESVRHSLEVYISKWEELILEVLKH
ncbi:hypothetical protein TUMEXPCC7403_17170 [Tumidithrix helvetica PCC 7403]|uniref:glycosyltransferase family 4 protein n=1 Tax=Tumidithrix helvetica TaxID=3457545 RepID=UPI003CAB1A61